MSQSLEDILGRADESLSDASDGYRAFVVSRNGRPQMGFAVMHADGDMDGFYYHVINHPKHQVRNGAEFVSFTHAGTAVTLQGVGLADLFRAMVGHTLMEIHEHDGRRAIEPGQPVITRLAVTDTTALR